MIPAILAALGTLAASPFVLLAALKIFPKLLGDVLIKELEHRHNVRLEKIKAELGRENAVRIEALKADLGSTYSTLTSSINFLSSHQTELVAKTIESTQKIWGSFCAMRKEFSDLVYVDAVRTPDEIQKALDTTDWRSASSITQYAKAETIGEKYERCCAMDMESERIFITEKLWLLFFVTRQIYGRVSWLFEQSFKEGRYRAWRSDQSFEVILSGVLPQDTISTARNQQTQGLQLITLNIEREFLREAKISMSAARVVAENYSELQSAVLIEKEKLSASTPGL